MKIFKNKYILIASVIILLTIVLFLLFKYVFINTVENQASYQIKSTFEDYLVKTLNFEKDSIPNTFVKDNQSITYDDLLVDIDESSIIIANLQINDKDNNLNYLLKADSIELIIPYENMLSLINNKVIDNINFRFNIHALESNLNYDDDDLYTIGSDYIEFVYIGPLDFIMDDFNINSIRLIDRDLKFIIDDFYIDLNNNDDAWNKTNVSLIELKNNLSKFPNKVDYFDWSLNYYDNSKSFETDFSFYANENIYSTNFGEIEFSDFVFDLNLSFQYPDSLNETLQCKLGFEIDDLVYYPIDKIKESIKDSRLDLRVDTLIIDELILPIEYAKEQIKIKNSNVNSNFIHFEVNGILDPNFRNIKQTKINESRIEIYRMHKKIKEIFDLIETFSGGKFPKENGNIVLELSCKIHNLLDMNFDKIKVKGIN